MFLVAISSKPNFKSKIFLSSKPFLADISSSLVLPKLPLLNLFALSANLFWYCCSALSTPRVKI